MSEFGWEERLKEEYAQLKERYERLKACNTKKEVSTYLKETARTPEEQYSDLLLRNQQHVMGEYLHILELRAELAHIKL